MKVLILVSILLFIIILLISTKYIRLKKNTSLLGIIMRKNIFYINKLFGNYINNLSRKYKKGNDKNWKVREKETNKYVIRNVNIDGVLAGLISPRNSIKDKIILQLHGGGYELGLPKNDMHFAKNYFKVLKNFEILTINYRVAPEYKFPAALEDSVKAYEYLLKSGYNNENIIIVGDSAGGGLALATVMYLRDNNIKLPKAIITMSAWTDLTNTEESFSKNYAIDPIFGVSNKTIVFTSRYANDMNKKEPYISPFYGNFRDFPKMLMQVGTHEMLLSDTIEVSKKAKAENVNVTLSVYNGMFHIFQSFKGVLLEADMAWKEVKKFVEELYK